MKTWKIPIQWTMKSTVEVEAKTLNEAMKKATIDDSNLPEGDYVPNSLEIYEDKDSWEIREEYNYDQDDEYEPPTPLDIAKQEEEDAKTRKRNIIITICTIFAVAALIFALGCLFKHQAQEEERKTYFYEHAETTAIVVDKYTFQNRGTNFVVVAEHKTTTAEGESTTFTKEYHIPMEDYLEIEVGDTINTEYHPMGSASYWKYISYENTSSQDE